MIKLKQCKKDFRVRANAVKKRRKEHIHKAKVTHRAFQRGISK